MLKFWSKLNLIGCFLTQNLIKSNPFFVSKGLLSGRRFKSFACLNCKLAPSRNQINRIMFSLIEFDWVFFFIVKLGCWFNQSSERILCQRTHSYFGKPVICIETLHLHPTGVLQVRLEADFFHLILVCEHSDAFWPSLFGSIWIDWTTVLFNSICFILTFEINPLLTNADQSKLREEKISFKKLNWSVFHSNLSRFYESILRADHQWLPHTKPCSYLC